MWLVNIHLEIELGTERKSEGIEKVSKGDNLGRLGLDDREVFD